MSCFKNTRNNYIESISSLSFLWCFLFGIIYLALKGLWTHTIIVILLAVISGGWGLLIAWLIYPYFIKRIIEKSYLKKGWIQVDCKSKVLNGTSE